MADARALLRAHRAENRIKHPHAAYTDQGKLLCKLCHEAVKSEGLWDTHIRSQGHRQRLQTLQQQQQAQTDEGTQKRKRGHDVDESMSDADQDTDAAAPKKRNKLEDAPITGKEKEKGQERTITPPLARRTSGTPVQGIEIAIPSRPATPLASSNSAVSTPKITMSRSPLAGSDGDSNSGASSAQQALVSKPISTERLSVPVQAPAAIYPLSKTAPINGASSAIIQTQTPGTVDEAEWAAFEAEMEAEDANANTTTVTSRAAINGNGSSIYAEATISAPALTAAEVAAKSQEEENERRKHAADAQIADEREDAERALEAEFEEMEELEGRVRRLKERREELRKGSLLNLHGVAAATTESAPAAVTTKGAGKENSASLEEEEEDEDDGEEEEDDFDGFRFRV
ncbi:hypothetical protein F5Y16DRAFT_374507 [Xylariaceae sp. FL0255]|nr:hypothetical protein F5Y16DRAFT_374507 [Xylariaceae sp. FL0255]